MRGRFVQVLIVGAAVSAIALLFPGSAHAVRTYTVTIPTNTTCGPTPASTLCLTMGDANYVTLPHRVTNTGNDGKEIKDLTFNLPVNSDYNFNQATTAPTGWEVKSFSTLSIRFSVIGGGAGITNGNYLDFNPVVTGANDQSIPAETQDVTETALSGVTITSEGGFSLSGVLPTWTRKSLAILLAASPPSVGVGGTITVEMQVSNHSSQTQNGIGSVPEPPTRIYTSGANVSLLTGPTYNPNPLNLATSQTGTITWTFQATATGTVTFEAAAGNGSPATSIIVRSGAVQIGNLTSVITMDSASLVSGQSVKVTVTATNNGLSSLTNVTLRMTPNGTAPTLECEGDADNDKGIELSQNMGLLGGGGLSVSYVWTCTVTGSVGQTFYFAGYATADGPVTSITNTTPTGSISSFSADVTPDTVASASAPPNKTFTYTVYNRGNVAVKRVEISIPAPCNPPSPCNGWEYFSAGPGANWTTTVSGNPVNLVTFNSNTPVDTYGIPVGGSRSFTITFASVPNVSVDVAYNFPVIIVDKNNVAVTVNTTITVTAYSLTLTANPTSITGNGSATAAITATLAGPAPGGKNIVFTTTAGTLSDPSAVTDSGGIATVTLTSNVVCGAVPLTATVTGTYGNAAGTTAVTFTGIGTKGNLSYVGGFKFVRTLPLPLTTINPPITTDPKDRGYFELNVQNTGCGNDVRIFIVDNDAASSLTIGYDEYPLTKIDAVASDKTLADGATATLRFGDTTDTVVVCSGSATFTPLLMIDGESPLGTPYDEAYAADKASPGDNLVDTIMVAGTEKPCTGVFDWREVK